jgi:phenylacetate-CoA ligase
MRNNKGFSPSWWERVQFLALIPLDWFLHLLGKSYQTFLWGFEQLPPWFMDHVGRIRARRALYNALRNVPAYALFLAKNNGTLESIPETDKESYIKVFPTEARCLGGWFSANQTMIDESSGSTGTPYNWVRSLQERQESHLFVSYFTTYCFGTAPWITINAFSMGAWATGLNMGLSLQRNSIVKNTGPDVSKILHTLRFFGPLYPYLILGYPPFLKHLIDVADAEGFPIGDYRLNALVGGEGMSEGLRDYLLRHFQNVYSGYGATDLEIGIAGETPLSVAIRRLARDNPTVRQKLFGKDSRLPMLFQYNPLMHHIEVNENRELVFTITRLSLLSPRIRYNIHDEGGIARYDEVARALTSVGYDIRELIAQAGGSPSLRLPFLWVYGRHDSTISVMGANIYPEDLEECLYADPELAGMTRSYCLSLSEPENREVRPCFLFEIDCEPSEGLERRFAEVMLKNLRKLNADFREAWHEYPEAMTPEVQLYPLGEGPFKQDTGRIKQVRLVKGERLASTLSNEEGNRGRDYSLKASGLNASI